MSLGVQRLMTLDQHDFFLQRLGHADAGMAGRRTFDPAKHPVTAPLIEARCLKGDRVEHGGRAPTLLRFGLDGFDDLRAEPIASQCFGQEEQVDEQETKRSTSRQTPDNLP